MAGGGNGGDPGGGSLASSADGMTWTIRSASTFVSACFGLAYGNGRFVAAGFGVNTLAYSNDGVTWIGLGTSIFSQGNCVVFSGNAWIAVGSGTNSIATSVDGITFTGQGLVLSNHAFGVGTSYVSQTIACGNLPNCSCSGWTCTSIVSAVTNASAPLTVESASTLAVKGSLTVTNASTVFASVTATPTVALATATGAIAVSGILQLTVGAVQSGAVILLAGASVTGTFAAVLTSSSDPCTTVTASSPTYTAATVTMTFQTANSCGVSTGAVAGIAVGSVLGLTAIVALIGVGLRRRYIESELARARGEGGVVSVTEHTPMKQTR